MITENIIIGGMMIVMGLIMAGISAMELLNIYREWKAKKVNG